MAVAAMGRGDAVAVVQMQHDADGGRFLTGIQMDEARNIAAPEIDVQPLLELADGAHPPVSGQQFVLAQRKGMVCHTGLLEWS